MLTKTLLKAPPKASNVVPVVGGAAATSKDLEALVTSVCGRGDWNKAAKLISGAHRLSMVPTWRTYKALLQCMARQRTHWQASISIINHMSGGQMGTHALYRSFVSLCAEAGDGETAQRVLEEAGRRGVGMHHSVYMAVAKCYVNCEMHAALMELPSLMVKDRVPVTSDMLDILLEGCAHCKGTMAENAKMILERAGGEKGVTAHMAEHYLLSLAATDWELGTRQYLSMPYGVRQEGAVMAALAALMMRGGRWDTSLELIERQLWAVKDFNNKTVDETIDERMRQIISEARTGSSGSAVNTKGSNSNNLLKPSNSAVPVIGSWQEAEKEATRLYFMRKGYTAQSGDLVLDAIFLSMRRDTLVQEGVTTVADTIEQYDDNNPAVPSEEKEEQIIAATRFISKSKQKVPTVFFSPKSLRPLLLESSAVEWDVGHALLRDFFESRQIRSRPSTEPSTRVELSKAPLSSPSLSTSDESAVAAYLSRPDVPMAVVAELISHIHNLQSHRMLLRRLAEGGGAGEIGTSLSFSTPSTAGGGEFVVSEGLDLVVSRLGPHGAAVACYNMGMWRSALRILEAHVRGPDELIETILSNHRLWREALAYAERCPIEVREETLRSFAVPVCSVCGQWEEVERTLDRIGAVTDVEKLLLREARRRGREKATCQLISRRLYRKAAECWLSFYAEESVLTFDKKLGNAIVVGLLDSELLPDESTRDGTAAHQREERGSSSLARLVTDQIERALAVAQHGSVKDLSSPCGALVEVEKELFSSIQAETRTKANESADPNRLAARFLVSFSKYTASSEEELSSSKRSELTSIVTDVLRYFESYNQLSNSSSNGTSARGELKGSLLATGVLVDALALSVTSLLQQESEEQHSLSFSYSAWRSLPLSLVKTLGGTSAAVDASLQRFAVLLAEAHVAGGSASNAKLLCETPSAHHTNTSDPTAAISPSSFPLSIKEEEGAATGERGVDWDRLLTVYEYCSHVSLPSMEGMINIAMADLVKASSQSTASSASSEVSNGFSPTALQIITLKTALMPAALKALSCATNAVSTSDVTAGASLLGLKTVTGLAYTIVELAVRLGDYGIAMRVYSDYPQLIAQGPHAVDRFLDVCGRTSGQSEKTLASIANNKDPISRTRYLLSVGQYRLAARYYAANNHAMNSNSRLLSSSVSSPVVPSLLHFSSSIQEEKGAPNPRVAVLREVLWALLREKDPVTCAELVQRETLTDVGVELIQPVLVGLTTPSLSWVPSKPFMLLHTVRFMEWLADEDPRLVTDTRMTRLLNVCAVGTPPPLLPTDKSTNATPLQHDNHTHALKLSLQGLRRIADKTSQHKVVNSLVAWINIGEAEAEEDLFTQQRGANDSITDLFFPQSRQKGLSSSKLAESLLGKKGISSPAEQLAAGAAKDTVPTTASVWTEERKHRLAKYYPLLAERAPPTRRSSIRVQAAVSLASAANTTNTVSSDPFLHIAVTEFTGEVTAEDVRALWYGANGGYRRHLSRLYESLAVATRAAKRASTTESSDQTQQNVGAAEQGGGVTFLNTTARITTPSSSSAAAPSSASHTTNDANTSSKRKATSELHALASNIVTIRFGTEADIRGLCEMSTFRGHTTESLRKLAFKSGAAIKATLRDHPSLAESAHLQVPNPLPQQLVARLSDYCGRGDMSSAALWRAIAMQVFQGAVTTTGVGAIIRRHQTLLRNAADQRWSREAEQEIADCVASSGAPPSFLESDPRRAKHEIRRYYQRFHWVIRQQGSFVASELDDIAEAVTYPSFHRTAAVDDGGIQGRAVSDALESCISTHTEEEVQRFAESREGPHRLADIWHASVPLTSFACGSAPLDISHVAADGPHHSHLLILKAVIKDTPLMPRTGGLLSPRALLLTKGGATSLTPEEDLDVEEGEGRVKEGLLSDSVSNSLSTPALAVAKRLGAHEFKDKGYITFRTAKTVLAACDGERGIRSAVGWLAQHGFTITLDEAKRMHTTSREQHDRRGGMRTHNNKYRSTSSLSSPSPPVAANKKSENSISINTNDDVWLRRIAHLPLLHGACTVLSTSSSTTASSPQHAKAAAIVKSELIRLAKGRTTRGDAREAWSLLLRYGTDKWFSPSDRLDVAVAMAGV